MKNFRILLFISLSLYWACAPSPGKENTGEQKENQKRVEKVTGPQQPDRAGNSPENADATFESFLNRFNRDSLFQVSRVVFPLRYKEVNWDSETLDLVERKMQRKDFLKMDLTYDPAYSRRETDAYRQQVKVKKDKATIEIRGVDNGIHADYHFEKRQGKWMLLSFEDRST